MADPLKHATSHVCDNAEFWLETVLWWPRYVSRLSTQRPDWRDSRECPWLPFPLEFRNHNAVLKTHSGKAIQGREKRLMISLAV